MNDYYLLVGEQVMPCSLMEWATRGEDFYRERIIQQDHPEGFFVSTVFLGLDHGFPRNPEAPVVFETMVFTTTSGEVDNWGELYSERYVTIEEAREGHERALALVESGEMAREREQRAQRDNEERHAVEGE